MSRVEHVIVSSVALDSKFGLFDFGFEINNNMDPGFYLIDYSLIVRITCLLNNDPKNLQIL